MATSAERHGWTLGELAEQKGKLLGPSEPVVIDQARIDAFADAEARLKPPNCSAVS